MGDVGVRSGASLASSPSFLEISIIFSLVFIVWMTMMMITTASLCTRRVAVCDDDTINTHVLSTGVLQTVSINLVVSSHSVHSPDHVNHYEDVAEGCTLSLIHLRPNQERGKQREPDRTAQQMHDISLRPTQISVSLKRLANDVDLLLPGAEWVARG
jgi:hypothetical protein